jgi:virginiamycin B lyase
MSVKPGFLLVVVLAMHGGVPGTLLAQDQLPEGDAKEGVQAMCVQCHQIGRVTGMHLSRDEWKNTVEDMIRMGAQIPLDWVDPIVDYLALNFPEKPEPAGSGTGGLGVSMVILRLPAQAMRAQGIVADKNGDIWFTGASTASVGKYSMTAPRVVEYALPASAKGADAPVVAPDGTVWFTLSALNVVGRLQPASGAVQLVQMPRAQATPTASAVDPLGVPFFVEQGSNRIVSVSPDSLTPREYVLPNVEARPRSVAVGGDNLIWYADDRGYIGRLDPATQNTREWAWPGGSQSPPGGIAILRGGVWSTECTAGACSLVRLDSATSTFQNWAMPDGIGAVTRLVATADNQLAATARGSSEIVLIRVK